MRDTTKKLREYSEMIMKNMQYYEKLQSMSNSSDSLSGSNTSSYTFNSDPNFMSMHGVVRSDYIPSLGSQNNPILKQFDRDENLYKKLDAQIDSDNMNSFSQQQIDCQKINDAIGFNMNELFGSDKCPENETKKQFIEKLLKIEEESKRSNEKQIGSQNFQSATTRTQMTECEFSKRMLKAYEDKNYENEDIIAQIKSYKHKINRNAVTLVFSSIVKIFEILLNQCREALNCKQELPSRVIKRIYVTSAKTYVSDLVVYSAMLASHQDIFYQDPCSSDWQTIVKIYDQHVYPDHQKVVKAYQNFFQFVALGNALMSKNNKNDNFLMKNLKQGFYGTYYFFQKQKCLEQSNLLNSNPDMNLAIELWNLLENKYVQQAMEIVIPSIKLNKKIFIPMIDTILTRENIDKLPKFKDFKQKHSGSFEEGRKKINKILGKNRLHLIGLTYNPETHVMVRILSKKKLGVDLDTGMVNEVKDSKKKKQPKSATNSDSKPGIFSKMYQNIKGRFKDKLERKNAVIIHVHGGGFVSMSSASHQNYTRLWANEIGVPIISVDYRLSPKYQFPSALNDVWQVYYWVVMYGELYLGIKPEKIILVGDSAGGNLVAACTIMAIQRNFRIPDGVIMCYPALSIDQFRFSPSLLLGIDDPILPYSFLKMCIESYVGDKSQYKDRSSCDPGKSPLLSPILVDDLTLSKFPKTRIMVAANDPLRDESFKFTLRLCKLNRDVKLKEYMYMPHGYLNFNAPLFGMKEEANEAINFCKTWINDLLSNDEHQESHEESKYSEVCQQNVQSQMIQPQKQVNQQSIYRQQTTQQNQKTQIQRQQQQIYYKK
eukprot:403370757